MRQHVAIVGGGPIATYALERLAALLSSAGPSTGLTISVFDRTGQFGAGATHSATQSTTSYMNRVASQIGFAADESNAGARHLLPAELRPNFYEWCQAAYRKTGNRRFNLAPGEVPRRYLHGLALADMFARYVAILRAIEGVRVDLHANEVTDILPDRHGRFRLRLAGTAPDACPLAFDHILLATGHSTYRPAPGSCAARLARHASVAPPSRYVRNAYPLARQLSEEVVPDGATIGMLGTGLTAIDAILHLTEGRGGRFVAGAPPVDGLRLHYLPSGREPRAIVMASSSGMFPACRPANHKAADGSARTHAASEHHGRFLTLAALRTLRANLGTPARLSHGIQRQLDFERHVFPLVVLELAFVYYKTLLGKKFASELELAVRAPYENFLRRACASRDQGVADLLAPVQHCFDTTALTLLHGASADSEPHRTFTSFLCNLLPWASSRWEHSPLILAHRFNWRRLFWPLAECDAASESIWRARLTSYLWRDLLDAAQGNLCNPTKAACDGVWRDLRGVFSELLDFGGLQAGSHRQFNDCYFRLYTRMSNGAGIEPMAKLLALVEAGLVDVSVGPAAGVSPVDGRASFRIAGGPTGAVREVPILIDARVVRFDARLDDAPLYPNLLERGLVRLWVNPACGRGRHYMPGALDIDTSSHPIRADGGVERRITLMGAAAEGVLSFQLSAARPRANSAIFNRLACWAQEVLGPPEGRTVAAATEAACT